MIRPFTCICLMLAAGSGLYLYQVKQRAFALEAQLTTTFHGIDTARDKTRMLRADWALMNDPERLQTLADQYLALKPMAPNQLMTLDQLAAVLPAPEVPGTLHPPVPAATGAPGVPIAMATPAGATQAGAASNGGAAQAVAMLQPATTPQDAAAATAPDAAIQDAAAIAVLPPPEPPMPPAEAPRAVATAAVSAPTPVIAAVQQTVLPHVARHEPRHIQAATFTHRASPEVPAVQRRLTHARSAPLHHASSTPQFFAVNEPVRSPRIAPAAATVLYRPTGSSLGMAGGAVLAPPRPLYSAAQ